ncbi:hypothetical protein DNTS_028385 [Danionella cerebrum]|uniref:Uncharacterized protein n=1 Tax=Danionella cerebrum TaxID=2873325 RepID=A0A553MSX3_9TELE|nr:hypothetical protein DNTS_028385 [Danionella translucida]
MATAVHERPPLVPTPHGFLHTAVTQEIGEAHLREGALLAHAHLRRQRHTACCLLEGERGDH